MVILVFVAQRKLELSFVLDIKTRRLAGRATMSSLGECTGLIHLTRLRRCLRFGPNSNGSIFILIKIRFKLAD
jgi:hypothetical protein